MRTYISLKNPSVVLLRFCFLNLFIWWNISFTIAIIESFGHWIQSEWIEFPRCELYFIQLVRNSNCLFFPNRSYCPIRYRHTVCCELKHDPVNCSRVAFTTKKTTVRLFFMVRKLLLNQLKSISWVLEKGLRWNVIKSCQWDEVIRFRHAL